MAEENERNIEEITFFGRQNSDISLENLPKGDFLYALNIVNNSSGVGGKGIVKNIKGNLQIAFPLPSGENICIGTADDSENKRFIFFMWNANGYHGIYQFNGLDKSVLKLMINLTDTNGIDILKFNKDFLILHADIARGVLLYWVDALNNARKTNISKLTDKTADGYGPVIYESFINAYKRTSDFPPTVAYFSDTTKKFNRLYGSLRRFAQRYIYDDGEKSNWSDFSAVATPDKEPFTGVKFIPTNNNGLNIKVETGDRTVVKVEIGMQSTSGEQNDESLLQWQLIATLNKKRLSITDNTTYTYKFYNDVVYPVTNYEKVIRPFNFLPKVPRCQVIAKNALVYTGGKEGAPVVDIDVSATVRYEDLFIESGTENKFNEPLFTFAAINNTGAYLYNRNLDHGEYMDLDGTSHYVTADKRANSHKVTIGNDVKKGNVFSGTISNGSNTFYVNYTAVVSDTATTVANKIKQQLLAQTGGNGGNIIRQIRGNSDSEIQPERNIYINTDDGGGNISFEFSIIDYPSSGYYGSSGGVTPVEYNALKDTGESVKNIKLGSSIKLGIEYEDFDGRKSLTYTVDALIIAIKTINDLGGMKKTVISLQINHPAPIWAKFYQIVRSSDLIYQDYIQMLIQNVIDVQTTTTSEYQNLVIGSLITYNKVHPNSNLSYSFDKGDRLRIIKRLSDGTYYPFFETEILEYQPIITEKIKSNITTNGTNNVTVAAAKNENVGRFILIEGSEREIVASDGLTGYTLNAPIGTTDPTVYNYYELVDNRGTIRIRKPASPIELTSADLPLVEIFKPSTKVSGENAQFFEFQKKFNVLNAGTVNAYHEGNPQSQSATQPAIIDISEGTAYVRNREMPITNTVPGTQVVVSDIEDGSYSDFYPSLINDNGRPNSEDTGVGEVTFGNRHRFSNNSIEDTKINGLNDFDNLDREDYNDKYGIFMRTFFVNNNIFGFKQLRTCYVPTNATITLDESGSSLRAASAKFLNNIQYLAWENGGVGANPEAFCVNATHLYALYPNSGVVVRIGGNGEEPISKTYFLNKEVREVIAQAVKNKAKIFLGFNTKLSLLCITIQGYNKFIYFDGLNGWITVNDLVAEGSTFQIVTPPTNGSASILNGLASYSPNTDYIGADNFTFRVMVDGVWSNARKICLNVTDVPIRIKAWRGTGSSCEINDGLQTGFSIYSTLQEYFVDDDTATGETKPNISTDADYISPMESVDCPKEFWNTEFIKNYQKTGCGEFATGSMVPYTVAAKSFKALSLSAANVLAENYADANGPAYANANGTCIPMTDVYIWGKIFEESQVYDEAGNEYAYLVIRTYRSPSATVPPSNLSTPYNCTNGAIALDFQIDTTGDHNYYTDSMAGVNFKASFPPGASTYMGRPLVSAVVGFNQFLTFSGLAENQWRLLQTTTV